MRLNHPGILVHDCAFRQIESLVHLTMALYKHCVHLNAYWFINLIISRKIDSQK